MDLFYTYVTYYIILFLMSAGLFYNYRVQTEVSYAHVAIHVVRISQFPHAFNVFNETIVYTLYINNTLEWFW